MGRVPVLVEDQRRGDRHERGWPAPGSPAEEGEGDRVEGGRGEGYCICGWRGYGSVQMRLTVHLYEHALVWEEVAAEHLPMSLDSDLDLSENEWIGEEERARRWVRAQMRQQQQQQQ